MSDYMFDHYHTIIWLSSIENQAINDSLLSWLHETSSMTKRLQQHCQEVTVQPTQEKFINRMELLPYEQIQLAEDKRYWLREVTIYGDGVPWIAGRTIIPDATLSGSELELVKLGTVPLGRYLFAAKDFSRDNLNIGKYALLWARHCRLRLSSKPLLLTELFLPDAPAYL